MTAIWEHIHPVNVHIGAVNANMNAHPSDLASGQRTSQRSDALSAQPLLFWKSVNASFVDTLLGPAATRSAMIAAKEVPTEKA